MPIVHLTARMVWPHACLADFETAAWLWGRLRDHFPRTHAALLMPNHPHLVSQVDCPHRARHVLARTLGHLQRQLGIPRLWEPVPEAEIVADVGKLRRAVRYVVLNPCRDRQVQDPLAWTWSTHRDVVGAVADPWIDVAWLARALHFRVASVRTRLHHYCSADPSASVSGTPFPVPAPQREVSIDPLGTIVHAAAIATRARVDDIRARTITRHTFLALAHAQGWRDTAQLAQACGTTTQSVCRALKRGVPRFVLDAARLCLGDPRLLGPLGPLGPLGTEPANASFAGLRAS